MATVTINNKKYAVPELNFGHSKMMEQMGLPLDGIVSRKYFFTALSAFVAIVVRCEPEQADHLIEQHVLGGGSVEDIYKAYVIAITESGFFKRLLQAHEQEEKNTKKSASRKVEQKLSETEE